MANRGNNVDPMLTTNEVAHLLNVHINTVRRWSNQSILKAYRIGSRGDRRFRQEDINRFLANEDKDEDSQSGGNPYLIPISNSKDDTDKTGR